MQANEPQMPNRSRDTCNTCCAVFLFALRVFENVSLLFFFLFLFFFILVLSFTKYTHFSPPLNTMLSVSYRANTLTTPSPPALTTHRPS